MKEQPFINERQELMILRYLDEESGFIERFRVNRLLARSEAASTFLSEMQALSDDTRLLTADKQYEKAHGKVDLWDKISMRIDQEERAEAFLGERRQQPKVELTWSTVWFASAAGAFASALLVLTAFSITSRNMNTLTGQEFASSVNGESAQSIAANSRIPQLVKPVSVTTGSSSTHAAPPPSVPVRPVEVDWMRSDGSVQILRAPTTRAPVIWVKKRSYSIADPSMLNRARNKRIPTATLVNK